MFKKKPKDAPAAEAAPEGEAAPAEGGKKKLPHDADHRRGRRPWWCSAAAAPRPSS